MHFVHVLSSLKALLCQKSGIEINYLPTVLSEIFLNINDCREFLLENEIIQQNIYCPKCETIAELGKSTLLNLNKIEYRCKRSGCQMRIRISSSKIPLTKLLHLIYLLLNDINYKTLYLYHGVTDATIASLKKSF